MKAQIPWKRSFRFLALVLISVAGAPAQSPAQTAPPAPAVAESSATRPAQTPVLAADTILHADVPYGGPDAKLDVLDIYSPSKTSDAAAALPVGLPAGLPVVLFVHGGEWSRGDKKEVSYKPRFFNEHGIVFISTNYRLSPRDPHPAQVDDVATAIAWTHKHAAEYGGSPDRIVIMGHSAGCHLVTLVTLDPAPLKKVGMTASQLRGVIAWSGGMYDLVARANGTGMYPPFIKATFGDAAAPQRAASPLSYVTNAKACPPFLFASVDDAKSQTSREASAEMVSQINKNGGKAQTAILVGKSHFTANHELGAPGDQTGDIVLKFVQDVTK
jgi:acetyl esterase/lipase